MKLAEDSGPNWRTIYVVKIKGFHLELEVGGLLQFQRGYSSVKIVYVLEMSRTFWSPNAKRDSFS